jgi:POT family proton-dependent oligopeptide transporter
MAIYFLPLIGGWLADRWTGRYRAILYISLFYCLGHGTLAMFGTTLHGVYAGLAFIAIGAGGIKPSVSAFLGDQFRSTEARGLTRVYGWFYWAVNLGALFGFTVIPTMRDKLGYSWAFGVPGIFMGVATLVFWLGRRNYFHVPPARKTETPGFFEAIRSGFKSGDVAGARAVLRILMVFAMVPVFWALYFQVNTSWVIQAEKMTTFNLLFFKVDAERMQSAGALLVMLWVPFLTMWVYPMAEKLGLRPTPLRRMAAGMLFIGFSFVLSAGIQWYLDHDHSVSLAWQLVPYTVLEAGEVLVSATGLEFAFGQAPPSMKSTIMSFWYLTSSLGNFLVVLLTYLNSNYLKASGTMEYLLYAGLMLAATGVFALLARAYTRASAAASLSSSA